MKRFLLSATIGFGAQSAVATVYQCKIYDNKLAEGEPYATFYTDNYELDWVVDWCKGFMRDKLEHNGRDTFRNFRVTWEAELPLYQSQLRCGGIKDEGDFLYLETGDSSLRLILDPTEVDTIRNSDPLPGCFVGVANHGEVSPEYWGLYAL